MDTITDSETFQNPVNSPTLWKNLDVLISSVDEYHTILSLVSKSISSKLPLLVIDAPRLTITTHSLIPYIDTERDIEKYKQKLNQKMESENINLNSLILNYPNLVNHCILWAKSIFSMFFTTFYYQLIEFEKNPMKFVEDMEKKRIEFGYELHLIGIIQFLFLQKAKRSYSSCVDLALEIFMVSWL
jgi:hypothetical protein